MIPVRTAATLVPTPLAEPGVEPAPMSVLQRATRVVEIANSSEFDNATMLEFVKLLMGPDATVAVE